MTSCSATPASCALMTPTELHGNCLTMMDKDRIKAGQWAPGVPGGRMSGPRDPCAPGRGSCARLIISWACRGSTNRNECRAKTSALPSVSERGSGNLCWTNYKHKIQNTLFLSDDTKLVHRWKPEGSRYDDGMVVETFEKSLKRIWRAFVFTPNTPQ